VAEKAAWFHDCGTDHAAVAAIQHALSADGLHVAPFSLRGEGHGIVCFNEINDLLLGFLRDRTRASRGRVLALACSSSQVSSRDSWRLLHAGADEVLSWNAEAARAVQIKARIERWTAIDELAESPLVRESLRGESLVWRSLVRRVVEAARFTHAPVLLIGESGTGKELLAQLVQRLDERALERRAAQPDLVTLDCTTLMPELAGSELFGHERGAFTGAANSRDGAFALADGGTLFLDEIGDLPLRLQAQLLRAIQEKTYKRVGGNVWQTTDFRLVCATNRDLTDATARGEFRLDLYYRIAGWVFRSPPLRERPEDILPLATHFLEMFRPEMVPEFDGPVLEYMLSRHYPGNVRDLRQLMQRIAHRHVGPGPITAGDIPEDDRPLTGELPGTWPDEHLEKAISQAIARGAGLKEISQATAETAIRLAVQSEKGNLQRAAKRLGVTDRALQMRRASGNLGG
jgi:transcriptional regulator with GAF, ATPase, and Fis domain